MAEIDLLFVSDREFFPHLATTLRSTVRCTHRTIRAFILTDEAEGESRAKVESAVPEIQVHWLDCPSVKDLPIAAGGTKPISYGRLFGPAMVAGLTDRLLYLDVDILVRRDLETLWSFDLAGHTIGAVRDMWISWVGRPNYGIPDYERYGFSANAPYFNAGVLVIDVKSWMRNDVQQKCLRFLDEQKLNRYADQDALNAVFYDGCTPLPMEWNVLADSRSDCLVEVETSREAVVAARRDPAIVHFAGGCKPWSPSVGPHLMFADEWLALARSGPYWDHYRPTSRWIRKIRSGILRMKRAARVLLGP